MKTSAWAIFVVLVVAALILSCDFGVRPVSWKEVHLGESYSDLKKTFPALRDKYHVEDGFDALVESRVTGHWMTFYRYKDEKICQKTLFYRLGTREYHHDFWMAGEDSAKPGL